MEKLRIELRKNMNSAGEKKGYFKQEENKVNIDQISKAAGKLSAPVFMMNG